MKARKTRDEYNIEQFYGQGTGGWEVVCCEESFAEAKQRRKEYRENMPQYPVRIVKRRVKIEGDFAVLKQVASLLISAMD